MARKARHSSLETRTARLKLAVRRKPYNGPALARGVLLQYRRNKTNGTWVLKASNGHGQYWTKAIAEADDFDESNGERVLTFFQAQDTAKKLAGRSVEADPTAPVTVDGALTDYRRDLETRGASTFNADYPRKHLTSVLLSKPVALLASKELRTWRDGLLGALKPSSVNRLTKTLKAALVIAASHDQRIRNQEAWDIGLEALPDAHEARNVVLSDAKVHAFVGAAYKRNAKLGLITDVLAATGARPSQATRLVVSDLHGGAKPKLSMPKSGKGGGRNRVQRKAERYSVPITPELAAKLKAAAKGRAADAPLLLQQSGTPWSKSPSDDYREDIREVVASIKLDPDVVTLYALRHSSIVRMLLKNIPVRLVASLHNTSVAEIERTYSKHITEFSDDIARDALLAPPPTVAPAAGNVVPLVR